MNGKRHLEGKGTSPWVLTYAHDICRDITRNRKQETNKNPANLSRELNSAVLSSICLYSFFFVLIQEVSHWEMNSTPVTTPDKALDSPLVCGLSGVEETTAAPSEVCVLTEELWNWTLSFCCCVVGHGFCVLPGVLHIWQPAQNPPLIHWASEDHQSTCTEMENPFGLCNSWFPYKVLWYHFSEADL